MIRKYVSFGVAVIFILSLSGCATGRKQKELESQALKNQISVLEAQIQSKDEEIDVLKESLAQLTEEKEARVSQGRLGKKKVLGEVKSRPNIRQVQTALINAGYNPGPIDGKMGRTTRQAIKAFQRANNLPADGKVGIKTWALLRDYLYKKLK